MKMVVGDGHSWDDRVRAQLAHGARMPQFRRSVGAQTFGPTCLDELIARGRTAIRQEISGDGTGPRDRLLGNCLRGSPVIPVLMLGTLRALLFL